MQNRHDLILKDKPIMFLKRFFGEHKLKPEEMTLDEARGIIGDFGEVVERYSTYSCGISESLLPYPREQIQRALRMWLLIEDRKEWINHLEVGLLHLAEFLPEPHGTNAMTASVRFKQFQAQFESGHLDLSESVEAYAKYTNMVSERSKSALEEIKNLRELRKQVTE